MGWRLQILLCVLSAFVFVRVDEAAAGTSPAHQLKLSLAYHFSSGDYGYSENTEIGYVPLTARLDVERWRVQATIPYLSISGPAGFVEGPAGPIATTSGTSDGLGDILVRCSYVLVRAPDPFSEKGSGAVSDHGSWIPGVELGGTVKFPTASESDGLGTGEFDFGLESGLWWTYGKVTPFGAVGYRFRGSPPGSHLRDVLLASVGGLYRFVDAFTAGFLIDYREASSSASDECVDVVPFATWKVTGNWSADLYVSAGLADGSPDAGVGLQLGYTFADFLK